LYIAKYIQLYKKENDKANFKKNTNYHETVMVGLPAMNAAY